MSTKITGWEKGFVDGFFYAVQQLVIHRNETILAEDLILESGITEEEFLKANEECGYEKDRMEEFITEVFDSA